MVSNHPKIQIFFTYNEFELRDFLDHLSGIQLSKYPLIFKEQNSSFENFRLVSNYPNIQMFLWKQNQISENSENLWLVSKYPCIQLFLRDIEFDLIDFWKFLSGIQLSEYPNIFDKHFVWVKRLCRSSGWYPIIQISKYFWRREFKFWKFLTGIQFSEYPNVF